MILVIVGIASLSPKPSSESVNMAPKAAFDYQTDNLTVAFDASTSNDTDGSIVDFNWSFGDGASANSSEPMVTHVYEDNGTYNVTLTVTDNGKEKNSTKKSLTIQAAVPPHKNPKAVITVVSQDELRVNMSGEDSEVFDGRSIVNYTWDFEDGSEAYGIEVSHTFAADGTYTVRLNVTDDADAYNTTSIEVTVAATPPAPQAPVAEFDAETDSLNVTVNASESYDPDGTILYYNWSWGDGNTSTGVLSVHSYERAGTYTIELNVTDDSGLSAVVTKTVTVIAPQPPDEKRGPPGLYRAIEVHELHLEKNEKLQNSLDHLKSNLNRWLARNGYLP